MKKKLMTGVLALTMALSLAACSGGGTTAGSASTGGASAAGSSTASQQTAQSKGFTGETYVSDKDGTIKTAEFPENYTPLPYEQFEKGFKEMALDGGSINTSSSYEDVAKAFGDDGIKLEGIAYEGYAYYGWYSDKDFQSDNKVGVLVTFKSSGGKLTYYAWSGNGIDAKDVE